MTNIERQSCEEKKAMEELGMRMKNALPIKTYDTITLLHKFLKARDFDVDEAEKMLRKHIAWRKSFQVDTILEDFKPTEVFRKYVELSHVGFDKDGDMMKYSPTGKIVARDVLKCVKMNDYIKHWIRFSEESSTFMEQLNKKTGRDASPLRVIVDLDKLTLGNATSKESAEIFVRLIRMLQDNYPECLKSVYIINAPRYYVFIFSLLKAMMSNALIRKIQVFSYSGWKEKLLEVIDADVLPAFLGGNRTDPDGNPLCTTFINHGGKVPEMYYLSNEDREFKIKSQVKQILVPAKGKKEVSVDVTESGSRIQWEFLVKNKDIGFGIFFKESEQELKDILPVQRYDTIDGTQEGSYKSQSVGKYIIIFDNYYSWMNSKEVEYCINVLEPGLQR